MKFFDQQIVKRRHSYLLLLCFVAALLFIGFAIHLAVALLSFAMGDPFTLANPSVPALVMTSLIWSTALAGGFFRAIDVRAGAAVLARRFGAVRASDRSRFDKEQVLLNVVAEIAIASSTPQPDVFVLRHEKSINAFVLGAQVKSEEETRNVIVITQGALDAFDRGELQAVIAHEFAHIANDDIRLNMQLLIALGGLMAIDEVGRLLVGSGSSRTVHPGLIVGYLLRALGAFGVVLGQLISAAFSRQREYLADATAAQFTRKPYALASALFIIKQSTDPCALHLTQAKELTHLCFQGGNASRWFQPWLASHPSLSSRIHHIDPHFKLKRRKARPSKTLKKSSASTPVHSEFAAVAEDVVKDQLGDRIVLMLTDANQCLAALFALFASEDKAKRAMYLENLAEGYPADFVNLVEDTMRQIPHELKHQQVAIVEQITSVLVNSLNLKNRQLVLKKLEALLDRSGDFHLVNYASVQLLRRKLDVDFPLLERLASETPARGRHIKAFDDMGSEFALLLSLMVESSGADQSELDREFESVLKCYTQVRYPRRTGNETGIVADIEAAFQTLYMQPQAIRRAFVQHCIEIAQKDGYVDRAERVLLDLFAASLDCEDLAA